MLRMLGITIERTVRAMPNPIEVVRFLGRNSKRIAVTAVGGVFVLAGIAMLVLPGPGIVVLAIGFAILGTEYAWAAAALERTKDTAAGAGRRARDLGRRATRRPGNGMRDS